MKAGFWAEASAPTFFGLIAFIKKDKILYIDSKPIRAIMLHPLHRQRYQDFQKALEQLQKTVTAKDLQESHSWIMSERYKSCFKAKLLI